MSAGLRPDNPADGGRAPREKRAFDDFRYLSEGQVELPVRELVTGDVKALWDRALIGLVVFHWRAASSFIGRASGISRGVATV